MKRILLVDDNKNLLDTQSLFLRYKGYDVKTASSGAEAFNLVDSQAFDLVITDIIMPEIEGIEVILGLKQRQSDLKIIAMSGGGRGSATDYLNIAKKFGAAQVLAKPFSGDELEAVISVALSGEN